jgi:RimJ/RimL family protein N-acetyltransferase
MDRCHQTYDDLAADGGAALEPGASSGAPPAAPGELILADGTSLEVRALEGSDRDGLRALFARLSPESRHRRFLSPKPHLSERELTYLTDVDHVDHEALVALDPCDGSIVAVARYARVRAGLPVADVAMVVADDMQRMGIGTRLGRLLVARARANCFDRLVADTFSDNHPARALMRRLGFRPRARHGYHLELELPLATSRKEPLGRDVYLVGQVI